MIAGRRRLSPRRLCARKSKSTISRARILKLALIIAFVAIERKKVYARCLRELEELDRKRRKRGRRTCDLSADVKVKQQKTAMQHILANGTDSDYVSMFKLHKDTFYNTLLPVFEEEYAATSVRRRNGEDRKEARFQRLDLRRFSASETLALALDHLVSNPGTRHRQLIMGGSRNTVDRYIAFGLRCLCAALQRIPDAKIFLPSDDEATQLSELVHKRAKHDELLRGVLDSSMA
uniref:Uncharacterized protein n=1 Tax=Lotharella globosa TaxID=91324 RepID=A0A7S3YFF3_9EUKA|mmetsp:Transcript_26085/g.51009  ORF Transcript_26085/g.51009 Transcript_26085/m.51009 type:complete len:234 (-) Transcript_26085:453-1154(-)